MSLRPHLARLVTVVTLVTLVAAPSLAWADDATAREQFRRGVDLYDKKQYQPALEAFRAAYAEKPSPGIKQNIALSLKGLGRPVEAATAFDEALDEGAEQLKPEVKAAMEHELADLLKVVATVRLRVVSAADKRPIDGAVVTVDGAALSAPALRRPVRLEPGIHVFTARAAGLPDPPEKKLSLLAGAPVDATFELGSPVGQLTIKPSVADAEVQIDGAVVGRGEWSGKLPVGTHRVSVVSPGFQTTTAEVVIASGASVEYPITLLRAVAPPPGYELPARKTPPKMKKGYIVPMIAYEGQTVRVAPILGGAAGGSRRQLAGASAGVRMGYRATRVVAIELHGEVGQLSDKYEIGDASKESTIKVLHWQITPLLRFTTIGTVRFTGATGFGLHGLSVNAEIDTGTATTSLATTKKGSGVAFSWLLDLGMQVDVGSLFLEGAVFLDMHGVGTTRENASNERMFLSSPSTRAGIRLGLGIPF